MTYCKKKPVDTSNRILTDQHIRNIAIIANHIETPHLCMHTSMTLFFMETVGTCILILAKYPVAL